jgi:hypothetical protein
MDRYSLSVLAPFREGSNNKTIASLAAELRKLANEFEGKVDAEFEGHDDTTYRWRYVGLVERNHLLEGKVEELEKKYSGDFVQFTLAEYKPKD